MRGARATCKRGERGRLRPLVASICRRTPLHSRGTDDRVVPALVHGPPKNRDGESERRTARDADPENGVAGFDGARGAVRVGSSLAAAPIEESPLNVIFMKTEPCKAMTATRGDGRQHGRSA